MGGCSFAYALTVGAILCASLAAGPASAQPYAPPPSDFATYWEVPAFKDFPYKGPQAAKGILFWSHGVSGQYPQWHVAPPGVIQDFARAGWDVVKVQRNNLHENGWTASGVKHVNDLLERIKKAYDRGYRHIIAAGQSYGGAISLEASARTELLFGVIAFAPGHGSDACGRFAGQSARRVADNLQAYLVDAIANTKAPRVVVSMADGDECQGHNDPTTMIRGALARASGNYLFFDSAMPIRGHGATATHQFQRWYGPCLRAFMDPEKPVATKETSCAAPRPLPRYLLPDRYKLPEGGDASLVGAWSGTLSSKTSAETRDVCIAIEKEEAAALKALAAFDAGPEKKLSMSANRRDFKREGNAFVFLGPDSYRMVLTPLAASREITLDITAANGQTTFFALLKPGC